MFDEFLTFSILQRLLTFFIIIIIIIIIILTGVCALHSEYRPL